jgi:hypothetical protein
MSWKFRPGRLCLVFILAALISACQSSPTPLPESGTLELRPIAPSDRRFSEVVLTGQAIRPDGTWVFSYLALGEQGAGEQTDSISVLTDVTGETYYELFELQGASIDDATWTSDEELVLYSRAWNKILVLELDDPIAGPPRLTASASPTKRRPPKNYDYRLPLDARAPPASYQQVERPIWPSSNR